MAKRSVVLVLCAIALVAGCASRKTAPSTAVANSTPAPAPAAAPAAQQLPANVPPYRVAAARDSASRFGASNATALKRTYDVVIAETTRQEDVFKIIQDLQIRETTRDPNIDWMFFNIYDNDLDVGGPPTRGKGVWAEMAGAGISVSESAAAKNDHSANRLQVSSGNYPHAVRYTNGDGFDLYSNTITPFEDNLYTAAEGLYSKCAGQGTDAGNADLAVSDALSREFHLPRSVIIRLHRKVKQLKAAGVATNQTTN